MLITSPLFYISVLLAAAYLFRRKKRIRIVCISAAVLFALFFTNKPIYELAESEWTSEYTSEVPQGKTYHYGIVLGGYGAWDTDRKRPEFGARADRLLEGIRLYKKGKIKKVVIASDASNRLYEDPDMMDGSPEGMRDYLACFGVTPSDLILENKALTTHENALFLLQMLGDSLKRERPLLITSAEHMRRSLMTFEQAGIPADGYVTDCIVRDERKWKDWIPSLSVISNWQTLLHEIIGYLYYQLFLF